MESRKSFRSFGDRLLYLFELNGIYDIHKRGELLNFTKNTISKHFGIPLDESKHINDKVNDIKKHTKLTTVGVSFIWIDFYHKLFKCSSDFLLGYSSEINPEKSDICDITGLHSQAIDTLKDMKEYPNFIEDFDRLNFLNEMLSYNDEFSLILKGLFDFLHSKYKYPVHVEYVEGKAETHFNKETGKTIIKETKGYHTTYIPNNHELEKLSDTLPLITLSSSWDNPNDNFQYPIDDKFLETLAIEKIREQLTELKERIEEKP